MILTENQKQKHRHKEPMYGYQGGGDELGDENWHIYNIDTIFKTGN